MENISIKYPDIFTRADKFSIRAQRRFVLINKWTLIILVVATIICSSIQENWAIWILSALLVISALLSTLMLILKFEKGWYEGRAVAESIKTLCWKFMTGAKPFSLELDSEFAQNQLIDNFKKIIGQRKDFFTLIGSDFAENEQLPNDLIKIRDLPLADRISIYKIHRLGKQKKWYTDKASDNKYCTRISFLIIISAHILALIYLVFNFKYEFGFTIVPSLIAISIAFIAWLQLRRYQELSQSYLITAKELSLIKSKINQVDNEDEFSNFVEDSETAISREHTLWLARRDNIELFE